MFSISQEILETKLQGKDWDWEDFEAVMELMEEEGVTEPIMFHGGVKYETLSGKSVWITHCCELTKRYHGVYLNRDGVWIATSWDENGMWQKFDSSMDIKL